MERRTFLNQLAAVGLASSADSTLAQAGQSSSTAGQENNTKLMRVNTAGELRGNMLYRQLGRTGESVSAIGLGGSHLAKGSITEAESIRLIHQAIDSGITFLDNSWDYNEGRSERWMGQALQQNRSRDKVFLMTKIDGRTKELAARQIEDSLSRLQTDHVDLLQFHEILRFDDPDRIFAEGGAVEAVLAAKKAGKLRFIGFTGHKDPHVHLYMLEVAAKHNFRFDAVLMPLNVMDAHFRSFAQRVLPKLVEQEIGVLSMKPFGGGDGIILKSKVVDPIECLHFVLNLPTSVVITGIDKPEVLAQALEAAKTFRPLSDDQLASITAKTRDVALSGKFELFKTTAHFDTTARHPDWLGADTPEVQKLAPQLPG
jgi:aryl-alcohol dehydrogenase-like predicted oxidoreductase